MSTTVTADSLLPLSAAALHPRDEDNPRIRHGHILRKVEVPCNNCGSRQTIGLGVGKDFEYETSQDEYSVVQCAICGLVYLNPRPHESELPVIYPDDYLAYNLSDADNQEYDSLACRLRRRFYTGKLRHALTFLELCGRDTIELLDIGAGDGRLLNWYRRIHGFLIRTSAVEMNLQAAATLRRQGHNVYEGLFEEADLPEKTFDVVHSSHVIEHVGDPKGFAAKGRRLLGPHGIYVVETPNLDCIGARVFRRRYWGGYHFPRHWTFYTPETLSDTLRQVGFDILDIRFHPNPVFWVWTVHHWLKENKAPRFIWAQFPAIDIFQNSFGNVFRLGLFTILEKFLSLFRNGRMGSMQVIARRVD